MQVDSMRPDQLKAEVVDGVIELGITPTVLAIIARTSTRSVNRFLSNGAPDWFVRIMYPRLSTAIVVEKVMRDFSTAFAGSGWR